MKPIYRVLSLVLIGVISLHPSAALAEVKTGDELTVATGETFDDDLYVFGRNVVINGTIEGDLIAFAESVTINGTVDGDLLGAARVITINGKINDDVRIAAETIRVGGTAAIEDDLVTAGMSLDCQPESRIGGKLNYAGYQSRLAGMIRGDVNAAIANCELAGEFGGDVQLEVAGGESPPPFWGTEEPIEPVPSGLTIAGSTSIAGDLNYESTTKASLDPAAQIAGTVNHNLLHEQGAAPPTIADRALSATKYLAALMLVGMLVSFGFPTAIDRTTATMRIKPLTSLVWGLGGFVSIVVGLLFILITTILVAVLLGFVSLEPLLPAWLSIGLLSTASLSVAFAVFANWITKALVAYWAGKTLLKRSTAGRSGKLIALAVGSVLVAGIGQIPVASGFSGLLIAVFGLGASIVTWRDTRKQTADSVPQLSVRQVA